MSSVIAALRGKLGSTEYYLFCMKAKELVSSVRFIRPDEWKDISVEEKFQREIKTARVLRDIVPYLVKDNDRFFGSVIVAAENFGLEEKFEPISEFCELNRLSNLHESEALKMGFLTFSGGEQFVPLDGQHRVKALQYAITGRDDKNKEVQCLPGLAQEDVAVILVDFDLHKARRIFTQVNKNARAITRGQSLVTDDEDKLAVLSREVADEFIGGPMVNHISSTLGEGSPEFTTLNALYEGNKIIIEAAFGKSMVDKCVAPAKSTGLSEEEIEACRQEIGRVWDALLKGIVSLRGRTQGQERPRRRQAQGNSQGFSARQTAPASLPCAGLCPVDKRATGKARNEVVLQGSHRKIESHSLGQRKPYLAKCLVVGKADSHYQEKRRHGNGPHRLHGRGIFDQRRTRGLAGALPRFLSSGRQEQDKTSPPRLIHNHAARPLQHRTRNAHLAQVRKRV